MVTKKNNHQEHSAIIAGCFFTVLNDRKTVEKVGRKCSFVSNMWHKQYPNYQKRVTKNAKYELITLGMVENKVN